MRSLRCLRESMPHERIESHMNEHSQWLYLILLSYLTYQTIKIKREYACVEIWR